MRGSVIIDQVSSDTPQPCRSSDYAKHFAVDFLNLFLCLREDKHLTGASTCWGLYSGQATQKGIWYSFAWTEHEESHSGKKG